MPIINKIYFHETPFYRFGSSHAQEPCYAVVDNISQYQETEFEDVFNLADDSWYKLNNLVQYEKYGVYGTSTGVSETYYDGKLAVVGDYEYIYSGNSWSSVGEISGSSRLPIGFTEYDYVSNNSNAYIDTRLQICSATSNTFKIESTLYSERVDYQTYQNIICCMTEAGEPYGGFVYRFEGSNLNPRSNPSQDTTFSTVNNGDGTSATTITCANGLTNGYTHTYPLVICAGLNSSMSPFRFTNTKIYSFKLTYNNTLTLDYVPCKRDSDSTYGLYDLVGNTFVASSNNNGFTGGTPSSSQTYPMYYDEKNDPPQNLVFADMAEANAYQCPYVGLHATIGGVPFTYTNNHKWEIG